MATHLAAVLVEQGKPFQLQSRPTPRPGPGELLIEVKSVALNPADGLMRNHGVLISTYPTVIGFDISGLVLEVGENVPVDAVDQGRGLFFQPGVTRVAAYAAFFWNSCDPNYGAFQQRCLVPWQHAVPIADESMSWNLAATLPVAAQVPLLAWDILGIPRLGETAASASISAVPSGADTDEPTRDSKREKREALLIWGASSSVGTMGVQSARLLRQDPNSSFAAVYAIASTTNHKYISSLGADRVFDYKDPHVVDEIVSKAKEDGLEIRHCFLAIGQLEPCQAVLEAFLGDDQKNGGRKSKIASAPMLPPDMEAVNGVEVIFVLPPTDERQRLAQFKYSLGTWLRENLANGTVRPSPEPKVVGKGLGAIDSGVDVLLRGVSCTKLVVEISE